jgi:uncharacterized protein YejL (UPF0352 family)
VPSTNQDLNLGFLGNFASGTLRTAQTDLAGKISNVQAATSLNLADMIQLQTDLSAFSVLGNLCSAIAKEVSDTMKSSVRNIN